MVLFENLDSNTAKKLFQNALCKGDVLIKEFPEADHLKYFIITGMNETNVFICSVSINSEIHQSILNKPKQFALQIKIQKTKNSFLRYDSFVNCAYPIKLKG